MRLSNVLKGQEEAKSVLSFVPKQFSMDKTVQVQELLQAKDSESQFRISEVIKQQTGLNEAEAAHFEEQVEQRTIEKLKEVQEPAYQEAYELGLSEGEKKAFKENSEIIREKLAHFDRILADMESMKQTLMQQNEAHIIQLLLHVATRLAFFEIKSDPTVMKEILNKALDMVQLEEKLTVHLSPTDFEFIQKLRTERQNEHHKLNEVSLQKVQFEQNQEITPGGCVFETNYGTIDATMEERVRQLWEAFQEKLVKVKDVIRAA